MLTPEQIRRIDLARAKGVGPKDILNKLDEEGHHDPQGALNTYLNTRTSDGRRRAEVNPGDPHEWGR